MNDDNFTISSGLLEVADGHKIWYMDWGNQNAVPIFSLHGGPGGASKDKTKLTFDPNKHRVIFFDQRGCGKSEPFGELHANDTASLINDIEALREHLDFSSMQIYGGSWGATLALLYAISHPERVTKMLLRSVFTGTKKEIDYITQGGCATHFPEAWSQYIELVPEEHQNDTVEYYYQKMLSGDEASSIEHVRRFVLLESALSNLDNNWVANLQNSYTYDESTKILATIEAHYFKNNFFISNNFIESNAQVLQDIPIVFIQGRFDHVCPLEYVYRLAKKIGPPCKLHIVPSNHSGSESTMREVTLAYAWSFLD